MIIRRRVKQETKKEEVKENIPEEIVLPKKEDEEQEVLDKLEKIEITEADFKERIERRKGDRRRGYRRIDERTLVSRAQEEAGSIRELAAKEGYKNGLIQAEEDIRNLKEELLKFSTAKDELYDYLTKDILEISLAIAKKIIKKEVELSDEVLKCILSEVLEEVNSTDDRITIKVSPEDLEAARAAIPEILENSGKGAKISVVPDEEIQRGSCSLIASNGIINADFTTQLQIIQNTFKI